MTTNELSNEEFKNLIHSYTQSGVTDQLYTFGSLLTAELQLRTSQVEAKATTLMGWSTGVLVLLFATVRTPDKSVIGWLFVAGSLSVVTAIVCAFSTIRTRNSWATPSDKSWVPPSIAKNPSADEMKRYHLMVLHEVRNANVALANSKARMLLIAEAALGLGSVLFATAKLLPLFGHLV